jgi:hypothetical protein
VSDGTMFDIYAVAIKAPHEVRLMDSGLTADNAEAVINFAVMRRGVEDEFYKRVPAGTKPEHVLAGRNPE